MTTFEIFKRPIAYQPIIAKAFGSVKLAVMWCQIYYWSDKTKDPEGWIYKSAEEMFEETGLSRREQETARKDGEGLGVLKSEPRGMPRTVHYKVNQERAVEVIEAYLIMNPEKNKIFLEPKKTFENFNIEWLRKIPDEDIKELAGYYNVSEAFVKERAQDVIDYCEAKGKKYANYKAALRNFIKSHRGQSRGSMKPGNFIPPAPKKYARYGN